MNNLTICFPGGAGGNWLSNLIYCLENNVYQLDSNINFHQHLKSNTVNLTHDVTDKSAVFFNGQALFNIYLNVISKFRLHEQQADTTLKITEHFDMLASEASSKLYFLDERTDLSWDDIFVNPDRFAQTLVTILSNCNIKYTNNLDVVYDAIQKYRASCIDPQEHFDNYDSIHWLGWCHGINKHLYWDFPLVNSIEEIQNKLLPKREFFKEFTQQYMINTK